MVDRRRQRGPKRAPPERLMQFDVTRVRGDHDRFEKQYPSTAFEAADQPYRVAEPVMLAFDVTRDEGRFHLVGGVRTSLELACSRCLEPFRLPVDVDFDLRYLPRAENVGEGEIEEDDLTTAFYADDMIDLSQLMAEQFHLALPMKPLCQEACRGLCPQCGTNWNTGACGCGSRWEDPRLDGLKAMLERGAGAPANAKKRE